MPSRNPSQRPKPSQADDRPREFAQRFNDELLPTAKDFSHAVAVRVWAYERLRTDSTLTIASALLDCEQKLREGPPARRRIEDSPERDSEGVDFPGDAPAGPQELG